MLKRLVQIAVTNKNICPKCSFSQLADTVQVTEKLHEMSEKDSFRKTGETQKSLFEPLSEDISHVSSYLRPTFNFAAYANKSNTIQELVKLGIDLHYIEKKQTDAIPFILGLNFDDIKEHIIFLNQLGLRNEEIARIVTRNPYIFKEELDNLEVRVTYLKYKKFTDDMILRILGNNPFWLSYSTQEIDQKIGFFQKNFKLYGDEVRYLVTKCPKLITYNEEKIKLNIFVVKEEMGFGEEEMKQIILKTPKVFTTEQNKLLKTFEYLHNVMKIPHEKIAVSSGILTCREKRLRERHQFLVKLGRDQSDPRQPNYIAPMNIIKESDANFATEVAKSSIQAYNLFLKTL